MIAPRLIGKRVGTGILGVLLSIYAVLWSRKFLEDGINLSVIWPLSCATVAGFLCWYALRGQQAETRMWITSSIRLGVIVGAIGFILGFVGPIIFMPDSNQGPIIGILITGPGGAALGAIAGIIYYSGQYRRSIQTNTTVHNDQKGGGA